MAPLMTAIAEAICFVEGHDHIRRRLPIRSCVQSRNVAAKVLGLIRSRANTTAPLPDADREFLAAQPADYGAWLAAELKARKLSQRELAEAAGVDHTTIGRLVRSGRQPMFETAQRISRALTATGGSTALRDIADAICFVEAHPHTSDEPSCPASRGIAAAVAARLDYRAEGSAGRPILDVPGTIPVDAIDAIKTLPHITVDRMRGLWVSLDQVTHLLEGWITPLAANPPQAREADIAAANPTAILALLDARDECERQFQVKVAENIRLLDTLDSLTAERDELRARVASLEARVAAAREVRVWDRERRAMRIVCRCGAAILATNWANHLHRKDGWPHGVTFEAPAKTKRSRRAALSEGGSK